MDNHAFDIDILPSEHRKPLTTAEYAKCLHRYLVIKARKQTNEIARKVIEAVVEDLFPKGGTRG